MRIGIVGCGRIARNHVSALRRVAGVQVVAVADIDPVVARAFAAEHGVDRSFGDLDRMLDGGLDAVTVCTPHAEHEAGGIRAAIDDGRMGPLICGGVVARLNRGADYYRAEPWRGRRATEGGGVLMTQVIHHIDLLQWFMGPVQRVTGRCANLAHQDVIEVEDTAAALIEFASGAVATVQAGTTFQPGLGVQVWVSDARGRTASVMEFPEGVGFTDLRTLPGEEAFATGYATGSTGDIALAEIHDNLAPYHAEQVADFVAALREDREPAVTGRDALRSLAIVEAVYESSRTGSAVELS